MADDELDLSDMSRLGSEPAGSPAAAEAASSTGGASQWPAYPEPGAEAGRPSGERPPATSPRPSGCGPFLAAVLALLVVGAAGAVVALRAGTGSDAPDGEPVVVETTASPSSSGAGTGEPSQQVSTTTTSAPTADLLRGGFPDALAELRDAAGDPTEAIEITVGPELAFLAYRDPANPQNLDRRQWRDGEVFDAHPNPIDDRVDAGTEPQLFPLAELDPALVASLVADAPSHYEVPVEVTHVIIDRFLPFDERVLIRVYASPTDGRSGGGYVRYDTAGALVGVCC